MPTRDRGLLAWLIVGAVGYLLLPWYMLQDSVLGIGWLRDWAGNDNAPAILQAFRYGRTWLLPLGALLVAGSALLAPGVDPRMRANGMIAIGGAGFVFLLVQGFAIGPTGWSFDTLTPWFGPLAGKPAGIGL